MECGKAQLLWKGNRSNATVEHDSRFDYRAHPISITTSYGLGRFERLQVFRVQCGAGTNTRLMLYKHISSSLPVTQMNTYTTRSAHTQTQTQTQTHSQTHTRTHTHTHTHTDRVIHSHPKVDTLI